MKNLNKNQKIIIQELQKGNSSMSNLARSIVLNNIEGISSNYTAERIVRLEIENIRLKHSINIDGVEYYICSTNYGYSLEKENSPILKIFIKRKLKRLDTCNKISSSVLNFVKYQKL